MLFHQSATINLAAQTVHPTVLDRTLAVPTHAPMAKSILPLNQLACLASVHML